MKAFAHKPEQLVGKRFEGTTESAKDILDWFRSHPHSDYIGYHLRFKETRYDLGQNQPVDLDTTSYLEIDTKHSRFYLNVGTWLVVKETGDFMTCSDKHLADHYNEI